MKKIFSLAVIFGSIVFLLVLVFGLLNQVSFFSIIKRMIVYIPFMMIIGSLIGYLIDKWMPEDMKEEGVEKKGDIFSMLEDEEKEEDELSSNQEDISNNKDDFLYKTKNVNVKINPKDAAKAVSSFLQKEDN